MDYEVIEPTGSIIKEYLEERGISQKELAVRMNTSEKHISNVLKGNCRLTEEFALKLEKIITGVPATYWLNYESKYRECLAREEEIDRISNWNLEELAKQYSFKEVFHGLGMTLVEQALEMLKLLKISDFNNFDSVYGNLAVDFFEDGGEKRAIAIWLNLCEKEIEIQNKDLTNVEYKESDLRNSLTKFKILSNNEQTEASVNSCRKLCNKLGIYLVLCENITNSKVRGALTTYKGHPAIYLSGRFKSHSHIWFAFIHEVGHLLLHYNKNDTIISIEEQTGVKEEEANRFAREFFMDEGEYRKFIEGHSYSKDKIREFARQQNTLPMFVVARLKHDKEIGYEEYAYL